MVSAEMLRARAPFFLVETPFMAFPGLQKKRGQGALREDFVKFRLGLIKSERSG